MKKINQINIFIVEDNKVFTIALKANIETAFAKKNIKIHSFETGEECMEQYIREKPQVVILDYHLNSLSPKATNGIRILNWIKKKNYDTNVIMLSSDDNIEIAIESFKHGASDYVVKTETQFHKINYSLYNIFKIIEAKSETKNFKFAFVIVLCLFTLLVAGAITIHLLNPFLF